MLATFAPAALPWLAYDSYGTTHMILIWVAGVRRIWHDSYGTSGDRTAMYKRALAAGQGACLSAQRERRGAHSAL